MNESMEEGNSISPIRNHTQSATITNGVYGATSSPNQAGDPDSSWYEYPDVSGVQANTAGQEPQAAGHTTIDEDKGDDQEEGDGAGDAKSETSSVMFDYDVDPEGFARRLDELAGTLEVGEREARALRWGPAIGNEGNAPLLSISDFKTLVNHHLDTTEWRYSQHRDGVAEGLGRDPGGQLASHPIKVLGPVRGALGQAETGM